MKKTVILCKKGFTLIEVIVVAAIIAILAGILVPMIFSQIEESKKTRAAGDVKSLQQALSAVRTNTLRWPTIRFDGGACTEDVEYMVNTSAPLPDITIPVAAGALVGTGINFGDVLGQNKQQTFSNPAASLSDCYPKIDNPTVSTWGGPYIAPESGTDPWGKTYIVYTSKLKSTYTGVPRFGWVISAGPNGVVDTNIFDYSVASPVNDDIGVKFIE